VCLPLRCGVSRKVMKNWDVLDRGPLFAMDCGASVRTSHPGRDGDFATHNHTPRVMLVRPLFAILIPEWLAPERLSAPPCARRITSLDLSQALDTRHRPASRRNKANKAQEIDPP
jgi:hypothetical protein